MGRSSTSLFVDATVRLVAQEREWNPSRPLPPAPSGCRSRVIGGPRLGGGNRNLSGRTRVLGLGNRAPTGAGGGERGVSQALGAARPRER